MRHHRVRLGDFDSRYLRLPYLHGEEQRARQLWAASHPWFYPEPWLAVRAAAQALVPILH